MAVSSQTIIDGQRTAVMKFHSDLGADETDVLKVDVSGLTAQLHTGAVCSEVAIEQIWYDITEGVVVDLIWDATGNLIAWSLSGQGYTDFRGSGPIPNQTGAGKTGDMLISTVGMGAADRYSIMLGLRKTYG